VPTANNSLAKKEETPGAEPAKCQMVLVYAYLRQGILSLPNFYRVTFPQLEVWNFLLSRFNFYLVLPGKIDQVKPHLLSCNIDEMPGRLELHLTETFVQFQQGIVQDHARLGTALLSEGWETGEHLACHSPQPFLCFLQQFLTSRWITGFDSFKQCAQQLRVPK
jgi:hypothetical protein